MYNKNKNNIEIIFEDNVMDENCNDLNMEIVRRKDNNKILNLDKLTETAPTSPAPIDSTPVVETEPAADDWYSQEMRGVATAGPAGTSSTVSGNICGGCGRNNPEGESYCENCGNKI